MTTSRKSNNNGVAALMIILAGCLWGLISIFVRRLNGSGIEALQIAFIRSLTGTVCMAAVLLIRDRRLFRIRLRDLWMFAGTGLLSLSFFNLCYFTVIEQGEASVAVVLLYTSPIWVMLMSALIFKEKITPLKIAALALTFAGCVLVSGLTGGGLSVRLILIGICSGIGYGLYSIFGRFALERYNTMTISFYTFLFSLAGMTLVSDWRGVFVITASEPRLILWEIGLGVVCTVIPYLLYTRGLRDTEPGKAAIYATAEPLVGAVVGICFYNESVGAAKIAGILLIFMSVLILNINFKGKRAG